MHKTAKIAISLPDDLLQRIERECRVTSESRSEFFRRAVETFLKQKEERDAITQYIRGYEEFPETEEELAWAQAASQAVLAEYPWEDEAKQ
ncbi:MAG: ribbon-helix-helix protein, CopG family [Chloroflexi bacterium]|nr:ribbon-helix-helix protein, CopG family [Chloroflexota bacterium]